MGLSGGKDAPRAEEPPSAQPSGIKLMYFGFPGRVEAAKIAFLLQGTKYDFNSIEGADWPALKEKLGGVGLPQMEFEMGGESHRLGQSMAILRFAAAYGPSPLVPRDPVEAGIMDQWIYDLEDLIFGPVVATIKLPSPEEGEEARKKLFAEDGLVSANLKAIDQRLSECGEWAAGGSGVTLADIAIFTGLNGFRNGEIVPIFAGIPADFLSKYPHIVAHSNRVARIPKLAEHYKNAQGPYTCFKPVDGDWPAPARAPKHTPPKAMKMVYFGVPGRAEMTRLAAHLSGVPLEFEAVDYQKWGAMKAQWGPVGLPCILLDGDVSGRRLHQSFALLRFVASLPSKTGSVLRLVPHDPVSQARIEEVFGDLEDKLFRPFAPTFRIQDKDEQRAAREALFGDEGKVTAGLKWLDKRLDTPTGFIVGSTLTIADIAVFCLIHGSFSSGILDGVPKDGATRHPNIAAHQRKVASVPQIAEYYKDTDAVREVFKPIP